jgi:hypothetical protein
LSIAEQLNRLAAKRPRAAEKPNEFMPLHFHPPLAVSRLRDELAPPDHPMIVNNCVQPSVLAALPRTAAPCTIAGVLLHCREPPLGAGSGRRPAFLDDLVGDCEQLGWHVEPERLASKFSRDRVLSCKTTASATKQGDCYE